MRALVLGEAELESAADRLGFVRRPKTWEKPFKEDIADPKPPRAPTQPVVTRHAESQAAPIAFWLPIAREYRDESSSSDQGAPRPPQRTLSEADLGGRVAPPRPSSIVAWPRLWRALEDRLTHRRPRREIDAAELLRRWSRGEWLRELPWRFGQTHARLAIFLDRSKRLQPFWDDQKELVWNLARRLGWDALRFLPKDVLGQDGLDFDDEERVLILGDLGFYGSAATSERWARFGREAHRLTGVAPVALIPCPAYRWRADCARFFEAIDWSSHNRPATSGADSAEGVEKLVCLASVTRRLDAGLLRELRRLIPGADLATEFEFRAHPAIADSQALGIVLDQQLAKPYQTAFAELDPTIQEQVAKLLERWHRHFSPETWASEVANLVALEVPEESVGKDAIQHSVELIEKISHAFTSGSSFGREAGAWFGRLGTWGSRALWRHEKYRPSFERAFAEWKRLHPDESLPSGLTSEMLPPAVGEPRRYAVRQRGDRFHVELIDEGTSSGEGSLLVEIEARNAALQVDDGENPPIGIDLSAKASWPAPASDQPLLLVTDVEAVELQAIERPSWAQRMGRDRFGLWAAFAVGEVRQRMRWIPPGRFWMGSPESEKGRMEAEGPRRQVQLKHGFWFADTPCTQSLWQAVMVENPSEFIDTKRPVEQVSWEDCQNFMAHLGKSASGFEPRLPTEAEWEYACRAGTTTSTYAGELEILEDSNGPLLDPIAWYGGNSGTESDFENGWNSSEWSEMRYPAARSATHRVALKAPNPWGLHDTLGNVFEWCSDWWQGSYDGAAVIDPSGPEEGSERVSRGGSWYSGARGARGVPAL